MKPQLFGRGTWYYIFFLFIYFNERYKNITNTLRDVKKNGKASPQDCKNLKIFFEDNELSNPTYIYKKTIEELTEEAYTTNLELLKKRLMRIISSLPCDHCKTHSLEAMALNNIMSSQSFFFIFHFFLVLRNTFYPNQIDRRMFESVDDLEKNKQKLLFQLIKTI
jgi:excinuclease UvrABC ATPase subunit